jgi:hypothetical protein
VLSDSTQRHDWYVDLPAGSDYSVDLTGLAVDYDLDVRGPGGFQDTSSLSSRQDESVFIPRATGGRYQIAVRSYEQTSSVPYTLRVTNAIAGVPSTGANPVPTSRALAAATPTGDFFGRSITDFLQTAVATPGTSSSSAFDFSNFFATMGFDCARDVVSSETINLGQSRTGRLSSGLQRQVWSLSVPPNQRGRLRIELTNLPEDYDLFVLGPDAGCSSSVNSNTDDDVVELDPAPGLYQIAVVSLSSSSDRPYTLSASIR